MPARARKCATAAIDGRSRVAYKGAMATSGSGLLDHKEAAAEITGILGEVILRAAQAVKEPLTPERAGTFAAQVALLVHYDPSFFKKNPAAEAVRAGIERDRAVLEKVAPKAGPLLDQIIARSIASDASVTPLFASKQARAYLQKVADASLDEIESCLDEPRGGAHLHVLLLLASYVSLPAKTLKHVAKRAKTLAAEMRDDPMAATFAKAAKKLAASADDDDDDDDDDDRGGGGSTEAEDEGEIRDRD